MRQQHVTVLGAGLAGLAAAQRARQLGCAVDVYEKNHYMGGHAHSHHIKGFVFDEGPHVSFTKRQEIKDLFATAVADQFLEHAAIITNSWQGHWVRHPAQCNLYGLPVDVVERCITDFITAQHETARPIKTYADWCMKGLGRAFSEEFTFRYTRKYWTAEAHNMSTEWVGPRVYPPSLAEVIRGALAPQCENYHYLTYFRYPLRGGFGAYAHAVADGQSVHLGYDVMAVDLKRHELEFTNGKKASFETLVSSLPLPELIHSIKDVPAPVVEAAKRLTCTSLVLVNVGIERDEGFPDAHWIYFYDDDVIFARGNFPHRLSPNNVAPGCGSVQVEVYYSKYRPLPCKDVLNRAIEELMRLGILSKDDRILVAQEVWIPYANVLFDLERARNLDIVRTYLTQQAIATCGRYGEWAYFWTDDAILSGWRAAEVVLK